VFLVGALGVGVGGQGREAMERECSEKGEDSCAHQGAAA
jgi:hypothetical protein